MAKQSIFGRIAQLAKANINALLDAAEDPQKMLDQMVRDYTDNIREAEAAIAQTIGNLRLLEQDHAEDVKEAAEWGTKALAASNKADEFRAAGDIANADKFDNLAKIALGKQMQSEKEAKAAEPQIAAQTQVVAQLKDGLSKMHAKLDELKTKRDELNARQKTVQAQAQVADALKAFDVMDPTSEVARFEEKVRREEARVMGQQELAASSIDAQFNDLEELGRQSELDARLAALKAQNS
ncbi:MAG: PspA/IM30 family protein [Rothia sp. (in: high G+C Gram-positive bacteria)]|uniref:PspA/IM30 family protein n=1 Tax=Rothia sp. (in: high G+C Gram-positive bacteria) TaxID=1885016 RepID=UPI0026E0C0E8|nr:PspA/IM30 family protein [Rothia sp. (in: high G+C Gram-positive bacteria)]MDO5750102.1 PspA/IM30 family protein [Rothia sp. (in: high G+C Gram-positive bacteria)]